MRSGSFRRTGALDRLDRLVESPAQGPDEAKRPTQFEELKRQRELASIALGEFQTQLLQHHGLQAGQVARLPEIQAALSPDSAIVTWVDIGPAGPKAADPGGEHWGVVVRSRGTPTWVRITGTGPEGLWTRDDTGLSGRVRTELRRRPGSGSADLLTMLERLRAQRLEPLAKALGEAGAGQPRVRRLTVLPSSAMSGIPVEAMLHLDDNRAVSYASSATVFKYLREQPRPDRHAGLLALGDPIYERNNRSDVPQPLPDHGLLVNMVMPKSSAATHRLRRGDVLLSYNAVALSVQDDLKVLREGEKSIVVEVWREGRAFRRDLPPGKLGVVLDPRPAPVAIAANRAINKVLAASRGDDDDFAPLPSTRYEVEALAKVFKSDNRLNRILLGNDASEAKLDRIATSHELRRYGFIHLATHAVIDEAVPARSAVILTQTGLPDPLEQALNHRRVFDGRLSVREIQRGWDLNAELVTLSACETALGRDSGGEGFVGFAQALLMSGARSVCLSLWKVDDTPTALLMQRLYANLLGRRTGLSGSMPKAEALREAKAWLRGLGRADALALPGELSGGVARGKGATARHQAKPVDVIPAGRDNDRPYAQPHCWAAFVMSAIWIDSRCWARVQIAVILPCKSRHEPGTTVAKALTWAGGSSFKSLSMLTTAW
jgi:hypothetical protein